MIYISQKNNSLEEHIAELILKAAREDQENLLGKRYAVRYNGKTLDIIRPFHVMNEIDNPDFREAMKHIKEYPLFRDFIVRGVIAREVARFSEKIREMDGVADADEGKRTKITISR